MTTQTMIRREGMLLIGASGRNMGKTQLACSLITRFSPANEIVAVKVSGAENPDDRHLHGPIDGPYCITAETDRTSAMDTCRMLAAGAARVFWIRTLRTHMEQAFGELLTKIDRNCAVICESNRLRTIAEPDVFVMVSDRCDQQSKPSARDVADYVDRKMLFDDETFHSDYNDIKLTDGKWTCRLDAAAIILAGGDSSRMGRDKSMLPIAGTPMIQHIHAQLADHFAQILIASNAPQRYSFLDVEVVPDKIAGRGPLMGIASALDASKYEKNFVIACDIPEIDIEFVRSLLRWLGHNDAVVPTDGPSRREPLFAVYRKAMAPTIENVLQAGGRRVIEALDKVQTRYIELGDRRLRNINTVSDYQEAADGGDNAG